jgi:hypothetical protein
MCSPVKEAGVRDHVHEVTRLSPDTRVVTGKMSPLGRRRTRYKDTGHCLVTASVTEEALKNHDTVRLEARVAPEGEEEGENSAPAMGCTTVSPTWAWEEEEEEEESSWVVLPS